MCTKHEFEIKHASKMHFIMNTQPETKSNSNTTQKGPTISWFHFNSVKESMQNLVPHGIRIKVQQNLQFNHSNEYKLVQKT